MYNKNIVGRGRKQSRVPAIYTTAEETDMLVYDGTKKDFLRSVEQDTIALEIENKIYEKMRHRTAKNEFRSWENSMEYMYTVLNDREIPQDAGIAIEYNIPQTSKRVDFLISGYDKKRDANVVLIELKQWDELRAVPGRDGLVETYTGNGLRRACLNEREKENSHDRGNH